MSNANFPDFESVYAGEPILEGHNAVPWNIGEPQPAVAALIEAGEVRGEVLDAGCGVGETTLHLTARGCPAVGVDLSPTAIRQAREAAEARGLDAEFHVADITALQGFDGRFGTVIDSTLFHSLPVEARDDYLAAIARAAAPGALLHVLVFSRAARFPGGEGPNAVDEQELRDAVAPHWTVDRVVPSTIAAFMPASLDAERDGKDRALMPAYLLTAHRPG